MTTVLDCIERIPEKLSVMAAHREERFQEFKQYIRGTKIKEIVFIASGSSYNSAFTARSFFEQEGFDVRFVYPNIFVNYSEILHSNALYVVISQGGSTRLVYEALLKIKQAGCKHCAITADRMAPIAQVADIAIEMGCGYEEFMYRTLGYSTTVATCFQLAIAIGEVNGTLQQEAVLAYEEEFQKMIQNLPLIKDITMKWYECHRFSLMHKDHMMFAGTNDLWPVCNEADIKVMEMVPLITRSFELEEFIHGPQNAFDNTTAYFLYGRKGEDEEKIKAIASFLKKEIGFCCIVGNLAQDQRDLYFEEASHHFGALEYVTAAQVMAYKLADDHGRDLSRPVNGQVKKYISKTL